MTEGPGDIFLVDLGIDTSGHELAFIRPAILLHTEGNISLVIPLSGNVARLRFRGTALIKPDATNGLAKPSIALVFQIRAIDTRRVFRRIGMLSQKDKRSVNKTIRSVAFIA